MVARVLGVRLLTLDATVVLTPAEVAPRAASPSARRPRRRVAVGRSLAEATRQIDEGAALLAATRNGASRGR
ncbi:MAG: hypothetical protein ABI950_03050 [Solirubrobacteraceae bacterium]